MKYLSANMQKDREEKREELRLFLLQKDRAIIELGLDETETANLLEKRQRQQYLGVEHAAALTNWKSRGQSSKKTRKDKALSLNKQSTSSPKMAKQKTKRIKMRNANSPKTKEEVKLNYQLYKQSTNLKLKECI